VLRIKPIKKQIGSATKAIILNLFYMDLEAYPTYLFRQEGLIENISIRAQ
jgi:hypothetical protein